MRTRLFTFLLVTVVVASACVDSAATAPASRAVVDVEGGRVSGSEIGDGVWAYKGIPFAAPPVGRLRWRPPQPVAPWDGVRDATRFGPACLQTPG